MEGGGGVDSHYVAKLIKNQVGVRGNIRKGAEGWHWSCTWMAWREWALHEICTWHWARDIIFVIVNPPSNSAGWGWLFSFYSERISVLFRLHSTELKSKPVQLLSPLLDSMPFLLAGILFLTVSNRLFPVIPSAQLPFPSQNFSWPAILVLHYSPSSPNQGTDHCHCLCSHSTLYGISLTVIKYIHCNF